MMLSIQEASINFGGVHALRDVTFGVTEGSIKAIIDNSCAYSGCHLDGSAPGVYTTYSGVASVVESGRFREKVVSLRDDPNLGMPPDFAPEGRPKDLTQFELELIQCWLENNYPEK